MKRVPNMKTTMRKGVKFVQIAGYLDNTEKVFKWWLPLEKLPELSGKLTFWRVE